MAKKFKALKDMPEETQDNIHHQRAVLQVATVCPKRAIWERSMMGLWDNNQRWQDCQM